MEQEKKPKYIQYSKILTGVFAAVMLPVSVYVIVRCLNLAEMAIQVGFSGALPYVTAIVGFVEASVTAVLGFYYQNSKAEKVAKLKNGNSYKQDY